MTTADRGRTLSLAFPVCLASNTQQPGLYEFTPRLFSLCVLSAWPVNKVRLLRWRRYTACANHPRLLSPLAGVVDSACWTSSVGCCADTLGGWYVWVCVTRSTVARGWLLGSRRSSLAGHLLRNHRHCVFTCHHRQQRLNWTKREKTRTKTRKQSSREEVVTSMCKGPCFAWIGLIDIYSGNSKLGHLYQDIDAWKHGKVICCSALQLQWLSVLLTVLFALF